MRDWQVRGLINSDEQIDEVDLADAQSLARHRLQRPTILYLMLAQGCNWKCTGCPIPDLAKLYGERLLTFEDAMAGVDMWRRHIEAYPPDDEPYFVIMYGGEPLLNRSVLEQLLPAIVTEKESGRLPAKLELMLCTNGQLIDGRLANFLKRYSVKVALGMDGPGDTNDKTRRTCENTGTSAVITHAIDALVTQDVQVVVSTTMTPDNIQRIPEFRAQLKAAGVQGFGLNLLKGLPLRLLSFAESAAYAKAAAQAVLEGLGQSDDDSFYEYQLQKRLESLRTGLPYPVDCTCYGNQLVIQADGQVGNCPFQRHDHGHVRELSQKFQIGNSPTVRLWQNRLPIFNQEMGKNMVANALHGGGCAWSSYEVHGSETAEDVCNATFAQEVQCELIWSLLPADRAIEPRRGETSHWNHRRLRSLHDSTA
ncbi:MAG: radical SAM protein [Candidatus Kerfeldbacteria bacterium]|nr:radical SAM protein [Candidatus Kerfeldbacteria bacterium]